MSGGHLCEAEAPTEPAGETRGFQRQSLWSRSAERETSLLQKAQGVQGPSPGVPALLVFKAFASAKANNYILLSHSEMCQLVYVYVCTGAGVQRTPLQSRSADRAGRREIERVMGLSVHSRQIPSIRYFDLLAYPGFVFVRLTGFVKSNFFLRFLMWQTKGGNPKGLPPL